MSRSFADSARSFGLLLIGGICLGSFAPLSKVAIEAGVPPLTYMLYAAAGAAIGLAVWIGLFDRLPRPGVPFLRYSVVAGLTGYALPSVITVLAVTRVGAGFVAISFTLVPILIYALALALRLEGFHAPRVAGVLAGLCGALILTYPRFAGGSDAGIAWTIITLMIPVSLALSGIYRTIAWPEAYTPIQLTLGMLSLSALALAVAAPLNGEAYLLFANGNPADVIVAAQMVAAFLSYAILFKIQREHGPVFQSLMGYVSTATGIVAGYMVFREAAPQSLWLALALLVIGMLLVNRKPA